MATLVPCLVSLRGEFNAAAPGRDKASDGWLGDAAHRRSSSDHNPDESGTTPYEDADNVDEVHALDVDDTGPWPWSFDAKVEHIRREHAAGRDNRLQNIIRNGKIASRSWGWEWRDYDGANGHYQHAHFSARYTTAAENDTSPWGVHREVPTVADATVVGFSAGARDILKAEATEGSVGYKGGGLPTWPGMPAAPNYLNAFTKMFQMVADLAGQVAALQVANSTLQQSLDALTRDPADGTEAEAEQHPIVRAVRYAQDTPAPPA
jgi:hypothetical protein